MTRIETIVTADEHGVVHLDLALGPDSAGASVKVTAEASACDSEDDERRKLALIASLQGAWLGEFEEMPDPPPEDAPEDFR